ncbi:MAG: PIN/TRAM domain-containing protein [Phycisphaerae bacterium]|nr:PIN/TRAM domain-containing protein [Phycisphaerae bacterium]
MILLYAIRALFALAMVAAGWSVVQAGDLMPENRSALFVGIVVLSAAVIGFDALMPRKSLAAIAGVFFGLVVGLAISYGLGLVLELLADVFLAPADPSVYGRLVARGKILLDIICCFLCVSFILQTKDDIRFVIPYVEFARQLKGRHPLILDTSVIIDGRIADIAETGILDQPLVVPRFVLKELQAVADSSDRLKRNRGRRGLDILNRMQASQQYELQILEGGIPPSESGEGVDQKLLTLTKSLGGRLVTNDFNLAKVARLQDVPIININDLANALKPVALPGEALSVRIVRAGEEPNQGVGYLDDGTMVVVESGRNHIGSMVGLSVTSVLQTSAGRMIFGRLDPGAMANAASDETARANSAAHR